MRGSLIVIAALVAAGGCATGSDLDGDDGSDGGGAYCADVEAPIDFEPDGTPIDPSVAEQAQALQPALAAALEEEDADAIQAAVCMIRDVLGQWQGVAEAEAEYRSSSAEPPPDPQMVLEDLAVGLAGQFGSEAWSISNASTHGEDMTAALRTPCSLLRAYVNTAAVSSGESRTMLLAAAQPGFDWLVSVQQPSGVFPFPDLSQDALDFLEECTSNGQSAEDCMEALPRVYELALIGKQRWEAAGMPAGVLVDGWFVDASDLDPGGLQFDTGVCTDALIDGYEVLGRADLLESATRAGAWAAQQSAVPNWNYNAFSVSLLARLASIDDSEPWAGMALEKAKIGVLPGAMENGRWYDPHNARIVYHQILLRALFELDRIVDDAWVTQTVGIALARSEAEILDRGATALDDGIEAHLLAVDSGSGDQAVLNILVNAALDGGPNTPFVSLWVRQAIESP